ncbi:MAG TPA: SDR family NAD(P)-dependent oxidoreductase [Vicinamibacteria bacterium]|nr:SDR family NAD(P)-dependent oxidoreductase [Vicinamibacteria bacterium]
MSPTDIAVVGRALRVPGARNVSEFWDNLHRGKESIRRLSDDELRARGVDPALLADPAYVKRGAPLEDLELFDAGFFGFSPREAAIMDPQHRHFLEVAWEALEDAGHAPESFAGRIGVFAGSGMSAYMPYHLFTNPKLMASVGLFLARHTGNDKDFLTTRASYLFDLRGPSVNIQTACSTSLVAIHAACQSLVNHECDLALAGGVTIELPHGLGYLYHEGEILSDDGHCRAFDRRAKGTVFGSGAGVVVLRRLGDAFEDGDTVYAVVKGSAVNNDGGRKVGYLAPSVDGQAEAVAEALHVSGVPVESVTYVECHGTGTPVGDPIEVTGLTRAFRSFTERSRFCAIGSVKTNIGHLDTAAGVASFVKVVEMLRHRALVPSLHFHEPNPEVEWEKSPFFVADRAAPWPSDGPRRAGVNSLGVGGTNAHVVVEEAAAPPPPAPSRGPTPLLLSARTKASLDRATARLADRLEADPSLDVANVAFTLAAGRRRFAERRAVVCASREDAVEALRSPARRLGATSDRSGTRVAFLFPGGGAQYPGMASDLYRSETAFRARVDECLALLRTRESLDLRPLMFPAAGAEAAAAAELLRPSLALPALLTIELALAELLRSWGLTPVSMIGHSLGEYAAAHLAGVFSLADALGVVTCRGRLFETLPEGAMLSVPLPEAEVAADLPPGLSFAAINGPGLCLVSGEVGLIAGLESRLAARGVEARRLAIAVAAHSPMLEPILGPFEKYLRSLRLAEPSLPFVSNVTGTWIRPEEARDPAYWVRHIRQPVRFADGLRALVAEGNPALLEVGPGRTLTSLARSHPAVGTARPVIPALRHPQDPTSDLEAVLAAMGQLWMAGVDADWRAFFGPGRQRVSLPAYSFDHERHWIEPGDGFFLRPEKATALAKNPDRSAWTYRPVWRRSEAPRRRAVAARNVLVFEDETGLGRELVLELRAAGHAVDLVRPGDAFGRDPDGAFRLRPDSREDHAALLRELGTAGRTPSQIVHLWGVGEDDGLDSALERGFFPLVRLGQALLDEEPAGRVEIVVVTSGAEGAGRDAAPRFPAKALAQGPARVLPRELPFVSCRSIDLSSALAPTAAFARQLAAELEAETDESRVALRDGERLVEAYERWPLAEAAGPWRERGVVLITGGLGGLALALAERLAREAKARFVLVGRTGLDPGDPDDARSRAIRAIEAAGGEVLVVTGDVADPATLRRAVAEGETRFGAITAAVHAAGVIDDGPLHGKERGGLEAVLRPKVHGARALVEALRGRKLDALVFFSSTSVALAPAGQVDYVAANAFLNAYARRLAAEGWPARVVQWGAWRDVGMAVAALLPFRVPPGCPPVEHPLLQRRLERDGGIVFPAVLDAKRQWVLDEHRLRSGDAVLPGTAFIEMARAALAVSGAASPGDAIEISNLAFTAPLVVPEGEPRLVETELSPAEDGSVAISIRSVPARGPAVEHAAGRVRALAGWAPGAIDVPALEARCSLRRRSFGPGEQSLPQEQALAFGPRWKAVRRMAFGTAEAVAHLELPEALAGDLETYGLHPGLLDMATGFAFSLVEGGATLHAPLSYGRLRAAQHLPRRVVSHVRLRPGSGPGVGVIDATLADEQGRVVAEIEGYVVKAVEPGVLGRRAEPRPPSPLERWVEHGITPDEGFDLFRRVLAQDREVQVLVSPLDLHSMIAELRPKPPVMGSAQPVTPATASPEAAGTAPRDEIEAKLAAMWRDLLGVEQVGLHDGFFALGGHSLVAVRLFARIKKTWGVDLPLATLFAAPTLEALAARVRDPLGLTLDTSIPGAAEPGAAPAKTGWSPLVQIRKGGSRLPFFCVHGAGGNLLVFRELAERLGPEQPVYGLEARGVDGHLPPAASIGEMAELYLGAIRGVRPRGPYLLGGYSGGGVVALEMATRLATAGEAVGEVILFDTFHPSTEGRRIGLRDHIDGLATEGIAYLPRHAFAVAARLLAALPQKARLRYNLSRGRPLPHDLRDGHITRHFLEVSRRHVPGPYAGRVTLFRAREMDRVYSHVGPRLGWGPSLLPRLEVVEVPGNHDTVVREPNVGVLASLLEDLLLRASSGS